MRAPLAESGGYAWWSLQGQTPGDPDPVAVDAAAQAVLDWLDTPQYTSVSLLGFSQGGAVSLQLLRLAPRRFRATVCLSGFIATAHHAGRCPARRAAAAGVLGPRNRGRGHPGCGDRAHGAVDAGAHEPHDRIYEDLPHSISREELADFSTFLAEHGPRRPSLLPTVAEDDTPLPSGAAAGRVSSSATARAQRRRGRRRPRGAG